MAREEFKIESAISKIEQKWRVLELEMEVYKKSFKIRKADEVFSVLEDHMSLLSAQKTTLFYDRFKDDIERWEQTLQSILETLETLLQVQRQWIYLE